MIFSNEVLDYYIGCTKEESDIMCKTLKEIMGKKPEEILKMAGQEDCVPVNVSAILKKLRISEIEMDFSEIEQQLVTQVNEKGAISGMVLLSGDNVGIFYNVKDGLNRQRFTVAHELAHCCLNGDELVDNHIEFRHESTSEDEREIAANTYAGQLLIPEKSLKRVYEQLTVPVVDSLAKLFQVSIAVMKERLRVLHMDYFDTELNRMVVFGED